MKIATIIGARPQFIKAALVSKEIRTRQRPKGVPSAVEERANALTEIIIHTGQHYDYEMSQVFFDQLDIPKPDYNLGVGSGTHANQTGAMLIKIEEVLLKEQPDLVLVYGDTNSTLAGALAAVKLNIPVAHVEAGMRSFNREMPEEINRVLTDHIASLHFCSTQTAVNNLAKEGITEGVFLVGDVMYDIALKSIDIAKNKSNILDKLSIKPKRYYLATVHRQSNTGNTQNLNSILEAFAKLDLPVIFPVHPRTRKSIDSIKTQYAIHTTQYENILFTDPVSYLDMLTLEKNAKKILTDSGGVQKEAYFFEVPCITLREETEWTETVESGWNILVGSDKNKIFETSRDFIPKGNTDTIFGDGKASKKIWEIIVNLFYLNTVSN